MTKELSANFDGTKDTGQGTGKFGKARFLPSRKRQRVANSEWRTMRWWVFSEGQHKISVMREHDTQSKTLKRRMNSALTKNFVINHWLKPVAWEFLE